MSRNRGSARSMTSSPSLWPTTWTANSHYVRINRLVYKIYQNLRKEFQSWLPKSKNDISNYFFCPTNGLQPKGSSFIGAKKSSRSSLLRSWNIWHFCLKNDLTIFFLFFSLNNKLLDWLRQVYKQEKKRMGGKKAVKEHRKANVIWLYLTMWTLFAVRREMHARLDKMLSGTLRYNLPVHRYSQSHSLN